MGLCYTQPEHLLFTVMSHSTLTRHPEGSVRELWALSLPLMISTLASLAMIFTDRLFLAHYSLEALNAVVNAGCLAWAAMAGVGMMTAMSEVFVAQFNGAKQFHRIGVPVWQMIWLCLFSYVLFIPLAYLAPEIFSFDTSSDQEVLFFRWMMLFGPSYPLMTALTGFFVGRGKTKILIYVAIIANVFNILMDWILIFGVPPTIPEMGVKGAAIATTGGYAIQAIVLAVIFFQKKYREEFGTARWRFDVVQFIKCFKIGLPQGVFVTLEVLGWALFFWLMTMMSKTHITIAAICQSLLILFSFFGDGLSRGIAAAAGNLIGSNRKEKLFLVMRSGLILQLLFCLSVTAILLVDTKSLVQWMFLEHMEIDAELMRLCLLLSFAYLFFEGTRWVFSGLLVAAGDTVFLMIAGSLSVWIGLLLPIYAIVVRYQLSPEWPWVIACGYSLTLCTIYAIRFKQGAWKKIDLISYPGISETGIELVSAESPKN